MGWLFEPCIAELKGWAILVGAVLPLMAGILAWRLTR